MTGTLRPLDGERRAPSPDEVEALQRELDHLRAALATRDLIWEAKLIIAAATGCDAEQAHQLLVRQSQHENRKLRDIAAEMVDRARARRVE